MKQILTAESVCVGHPDKVCDQIADAILDAALEKDKEARVACEAMISKGHIFIAGEMTCQSKLPLRDIIRKTLRRCGYDPSDYHIHLHIHSQSADIKAGVDQALETRDDKESIRQLGAGDQGTVYGFATDETYECLPLPLLYSHRICEKLEMARLLKNIEGIHSDGKAQVSIEYENGKPQRIEAIIVSIQHQADKNLDQLRYEVISQIIRPVIRNDLLDENTKIYINPSGRFVKGGPDADTGLTGRKLMVDTYGGLTRHGGGAFSGKDPTKVDRSAAYMARHIAKQVIDDGLAERCEVALSYAIGKAEPVAVSVNTFGTGALSDEQLTQVIKGAYDLRPAAMIDYLNLKHVKYQETACYGHFSSMRYPWELTHQNKLKSEVMQLGISQEID